MDFSKLCIDTKDRETYMRYRMIIWILEMITLIVFEFVLFFVAGYTENVMMFILGFISCFGWVLFSLIFHWLFTYFKNKHNN